MASELGVQTIQHTNGTDAMTIDSSGIVTMANTTIYSIFRNTTNLTANGNITAWEVPDDTLVATNLGGTFTHSSGLWTFPRTGVYKIHLCATIRNGTGDSETAIALWGTSDNGSNFDRLSYFNVGHTATGTTDTATVFGEVLVNIANTANDKVELRGESIGANSYIWGDTDNSRTTISFEWLAPAQ